MLALGVCAALMYGGAIHFGLFNDDPTGNLAWLSRRSLLDIFTSASGYGFYRPAGFAVWKVMYVLFGGNNATALHAVSIVVHGVNTVGVWLLAYRLMKRSSPAWAAAIIFACAPFSYEAVAYVAALFHPLLTFWVLAGLLLYDRGRETGQIRYWAIAFVCLVAALFTHENGIALVALLWVWELCFFQKPNRRSATVFLLAASVATGLFLAIWISMQESLSSRAHVLSETLANVLPFVQALASPFLAYLRLTVDQPIQLAVLGVLALILAGAAAWMTRLMRAYIFALLWIVITAAPTILFLPNEYVRGSPRLFYFLWVGIALLWALLFAAIASAAIPKLLSWVAQLLLLLFIVIPPAEFVQCELAMYGDATGIVRDVAQLSKQVEDGRVPVFVNLPVYFKESPSRPQGCSYAYPWVHNGAIIYPTYVDLRDFNRDNGGGDKPARGAAIVAFDAIWPPRYGDPMERSGLRDLVREHPVYVFDTKTWSFFPLSETWEVTSPAAQQFEAVLGEELGLEKANLQFLGHEVNVALRWRMLSDPRPLTSFVHVYDPGGKLVAQQDVALGEDGARLLYSPFELRQQGDLIEDRHTVSLPDGLAPGVYTVAAGVYDPATVERLPARGSNGQSLPDDLYVVGHITVE